MALGHRVVAKKYNHNIATAAEDPVSPEVRCFMKAVGRYRDMWTLPPQNCYVFQEETTQCNCCYSVA